MGNGLKIAGAVVAGFFVGSLVNMGLIILSPHVIPPPVGADVTTMEGLQRTIHLFQPKHFLFPFLAHALGTLVGAAVAAMLSPVRKGLSAGIVGGLFLTGGTANLFMLPSPLWFSVLDLVCAYLPMAWVGHRAATTKSR